MIQVTRETHDTPREIAERLWRAGGANLFGEPNFRAVWGWNRLTWIGGEWTLFDSQGNARGSVVECRREPKYLPVNRWHVEAWLPPAAYGSPERWKQLTAERAGAVMIDGLGPYPSRGDYELAFTIEDASGGFLPLTPTICERVARMVVLSREARGGDRLRAIRAEQMRSDRATDKTMDDILEISE